VVPCSDKANDVNDNRMIVNKHVDFTMNDSEVKALADTGNKQTPLQNPQCQTMH